VAVVLEISRFDAARDAVPAVKEEDQHGSVHQDSCKRRVQQILASKVESQLGGDCRFTPIDSR
jgi:hypothetical protein